MSSVLERVVALVRSSDRTAAADALGALLGGASMIVFVRDEEVGALLPAPGFPQSLPGGRLWREFLTDCLTTGASGRRGLPIPGGSASPAYGVACGEDVVAVVLGTDRSAPDTPALRDLLPLLASTLRAERAAALAVAHAQMAGQTAAHAEELAGTLDKARAELQRALGEAEAVRREVEAANLQLQDQAAELEAQAEELLCSNTQREEARRIAEEANRSKSDFLAMVSHELRTPLNAIGGYVQLVDLGIYGPVTDEQREALARVNRSQRHLLGLINDILNLARIESGRVEYRITTAPVAEVVADLEPMIAPQIRARQLRYGVTECGRALSVRADVEKFQQILLNLLSNAVKFTAEGGRVGVKCSASESSAHAVYIDISDTGIGIPADRLSDIFEPFVQVEAGHTREGAGTGLGLSISRDLARGMGGDLTVTSAVGKGSTFRLSLPSG